jgi:3-deoxy-7-phosphoheptulonate synthase
VVIVCKNNIDQKHIDRILNQIKEQGLEPLYMPGTEKTVIGAIGDERKLEQLHLESFEGVEKVMRVLSPYKAIVRELKPEGSIIPIDKTVHIGGKQIVVMAGPCAVEDREQILSTSRYVKEAGAHVLRGGAFKPRSSPYSFQGLKEEGLKLLKEAKQETGLPIITEIISPYHLDLMYDYTDIFQVGARNMFNYNLLEELGKIDKPIFVKRGPSATLDEFLQSVEYVVLGGNNNVILCERGIRTYEKATRNTLDLAIVALLKQKTHLPVVVDPSHGTGLRSLIEPMAKAAIMAGADGLMIETHINPEVAKSDGQQSLFPDQFKSLMNKLKRVAELEGRSL